MKKTEALKKTIELFQAELDKATLPFRGKAIAQDSIEESRTRLAEFLAYMERKGLIESVDQNPDRPTWVIRQDAADRSKLWIMPGNDAARVVMGLPIPERKQPSDKKHPWRRDGMVEDAARKEAKVTSMRKVGEVYAQNRDIRTDTAPIYKEFRHTKRQKEWRRRKREA